MDLDAIVQSIDAEISRLERVRALLTGHTAPLKRGFPRSGASGPCSETQADERGRTPRIAAAQKARWAKQR